MGKSEVSCFCDSQCIFPARRVLSSKPAGRCCCCRSMGQTDGRTSERYTDPVPHTMRAASLTYTYSWYMVRAYAGSTSRPIDVWLHVWVLPSVRYKENGVRHDIRRQPQMQSRIMKWLFLAGSVTFSFWASLF